MKRKGSIMAVSDQYCLRWNDHQNTLLTTFDTLLDSQKLTDVTLWAGGKCLKAHKVVLSACSPYFDKMLEAHDEKNPIIIFNDLSYEQLRAMLEYMYRGEVNVSQEQLDSFLKVAESLKIKGLTDQGGGGGDIKGGGTKKKSLPQSATAALGKERDSPRKRKRPHRRESESGTDSIEDESKSDSGTGGLLQPKVELTEDNDNGGDSVPGTGVEDLTMMEEEEEEDYYHHQSAASSSRLTDGTAPPHPPPDIKEFSTWDMANDGFMGAQEISGNNTLNSSQDEDLNSITVNPLTVIVLQEGTVLEESVDNEYELIENDFDPEEGEVIVKKENEEMVVANEEIISLSTKALCDLCGTEFTQEDDVQRHRENCGKISCYCLLCTTVFDSEESLNSHNKLHSTEKNTFDKCGKHFNTQENLDIHAKQNCSIQNDEPSFICVLCGDKFQLKAHLNGHLIEKHSTAKVFESGEPSPMSSLEERYHCKQCPRSFSRVGSLNYHMSRKHSGTEKAREASEFPHLCQDCGNRYKSGTQLCRHRRWECGKEPMFKCQLCIKKFHHRHGLKQHIRLHLAKKGTAEKTAHFCCEKCGRGYKLKSSLNNHMKWECGKEPVFPCTVCNVKFTHKGNLKKHILSKHLDNV